jgi:L-fucose/D-arabinose isomerase
MEFAALVTFTDARDEGISNPEVEDALRKKQKELRLFLEEKHVTVVDPLAELRPAGSSWYGIRSLDDIKKVVRLLMNHEVDAVIVGVWTWSPPMFIKEFLRQFPKPVLFYTENDPFSGALSQMTAACSSLLEWSVNSHALRHERVFGNKEEILPWLRGVSAAAGMRESALMLWGGTYAVKMDQLQDDFLFLKSFLVREILQEDQYVLIKRAEEIRSARPERCQKFWNWCKENGMNFIPDTRMVTPEALEKQAALLLAARDRLAELGDENIRGVSIKCQPEIYADYGVNACTLPAFLPYAWNEEGEQQVLPTVCEGDVKGLLTSMLMHAVNPEVPPVFGDLVSVGDDHIEFANCGAGSLHWTGECGKDCRPREVFPRITARANIHGNSGAAFTYFGRNFGCVTIGRLTRVNGNYYMQLGTGEALDAETFLTGRLGDKEPMHLAGTWGKIVIGMDFTAANFVRAAGANHLHAAAGDWTREITAACRQWNIPVVRIDCDAEMERFYRTVREGGRHGS